MSNQHLENLIKASANLKDGNGIKTVWIDLWNEIENWYGDPNKNESAENFLKRMNDKYRLKQK